MPRSSRTGTPLEFNSEIERTARRLRKQAKLRKKQPGSEAPESSSPPPINIWEDIQLSSESESPNPTPPATPQTPISPIHNPFEMAEPEQTLRQRATHDVTQQPLCITYPAMQNFELKSGLIHLLPSFRGVEKEDPHNFLKEFHVVCIGMKPHNITEDQIKLRAFPFALLDGAKEWLYDLPSGTITTWTQLAQAFLSKYFPESRASLLRREITGIQQLKKEAFHTYWERFKKLCTRCPQHGIGDHQLLQYFIEGLLPFERRLLNASSGGSISDKTPTQIRELILTLVEESRHNYQDDEWYTDTPRGAKSIESSKVESQLTELTKAVLLLAKDKQEVPGVRPCGICLQKGHPTDMCPSLQDDVEQVKAMGGYTGQGYQRPNFGYNQNHQQNPVPHFQQRTNFQTPPGFHQYPTQPPPQASSSGSGPPLEDLVKSLAMSTQTFQQETRASIKSLEQQVSQLATSVSRLESQNGKLPGNTEKNPKHTACAISLVAGIESEGPEMPEVEAKVEKRLSRKEKNELAKKEEAEWRKKYHPPPFPSRFISTKKTDDEEAIMKTFQKAEINIPLLEAIKQIPRYAKFLKAFCTSKRKFENNEIIKVSENVSSVMKRGLPLKCKDPGAVTIPCNLGGVEFPKVLLDNGASINVLPYSIFKKLKTGELTSTGVALQLADKSIVRPKGVLEDVLVKVKHLIFPADFYVIDMDDDAHPTSTSILLGRPFLKTSRTKLDCYNGSLTMEFDGDVIEFNTPEPVEPIEDVLSVNRVSTFEPISNECYVATNDCVQVLVGKDLAIGTKKMDGVGDVVKNAETSERVGVEKDGDSDGVVKEVERMNDGGAILMEKARKKRKRRKWKWIKAIFPSSISM